MLFNAMYSHTFLLINAVWSASTDGMLDFLVEDHPGLLGISPGQRLQD